MRRRQYFNSVYARLMASMLGAGQTGPRAEEYFFPKTEKRSKEEQERLKYDAEQKRECRRQRNLLLVARGGFQAKEANHAR